MAIISLKRLNDRYSQLVFDGTAIPANVVLVLGHTDSTIDTDFVDSRLEAANKFLAKYGKGRSGREIDTDLIKAEVESINKFLKENGKGDKDG